MTLFKVFIFFFQTHLIRGLYSSLYQEKPPYKKLPFLADFYKKKLGPFYKKLNFGNLYRPKSQKVRNCS